MKNVLVLLPALVFVVLSACNEGEELQEKHMADSLNYADSGAAYYTLERLLEFSDEDDLMSFYGKNSVRYDTIWGAEGFFSMGTILKTEPQSHIEITWANETTKTGIISVTQVSDSDWYSDTLTKSQWKSSTGVAVGISISELQKINGRPFTFSGFGWDYAGSVLDWQKGNLEGKGIAVQLAEGPTDENLSDTEAAHVLGDVMVQSDDPTALKFHPRVWAISVAKVQ